MDESAELTVVVVVAEPDGDPHAATSSERTATAANHLRRTVSRLIQDSLWGHKSQVPPNISGRGRICGLSGTTDELMQIVRSETTEASSQTPRFDQLSKDRPGRT